MYASKRAFQGPSFASRIRSLPRVERLSVSQSVRRCLQGESASAGREITLRPDKKARETKTRAIEKVETHDRSQEGTDVRATPTLFAERALSAANLLFSNGAYAHDRPAVRQGSFLGSLAGSENKVPPRSVGGQSTALPHRLGEVCDIACRGRERDPLSAGST